MTPTPTTTSPMKSLSNPPAPTAAPEKASADVACPGCGMQLTIDVKPKESAAPAAGPSAGGMGAMIDDELGGGY